MAISFVKEFSGTASVTTATPTVTVPAGGVPQGHGLVLSIAIQRGAGAISSVTVTDTKGNSYTHIATHVVTGTTSTISVVRSNVQNALVSGDVITITPDAGAVTRAAINIYEFSTGLVYDVSSHGDNGGNSTLNYVAGTTTTTTVANEVVVGSFMMVNAGRVFTAGSGFSGGTKVATTAGTGDRAVATIYKFVSTTGTQSAFGTVDSSGTYVGMTTTFSELVVATRSGRPKVWNGTAWVAHDAKVWNGTAWVAHKSKGFDGTSWTESK